MAAITFQLQRTQIQGQVVKFERVPLEETGRFPDNALTPPVLHPSVQATITLDQLETIAAGGALPSILEFTVDVPAP